MKFDGKNLADVIKAHWDWICRPINDNDRADFSGADLSGYSLAYANLFGADFRGANLFRADLFFTDLQKADLTGANLLDANLFGTKLRGAIGVGYIPQQIPTSGSFIAWKRAKLSLEGSHYDNSAIVKLRIPEDAERISLTNGECKASKAEVLEIQTMEGDPLPGAVCISIKDGRTRYRAGETVVARDYVDDLFNEHTPGIFFYLDRRRAVLYLTKGDDADGRPNPLDVRKIEEECRDTGIMGTPPQVLDYLVGDEIKEMAYALKHLPPEQCAAVVMKYWDHCTPERLAGVLKMTVEEAEALWQQAKENIAGFLE